MALGYPLMWYIDSANTPTMNIVIVALQCGDMVVTGESTTSWACPVHGLQSSISNSAVIGEFQSTIYYNYGS